MESIFGLSSPYVSLIANRVLKIIFDSKEHLLSDLRNLTWLSKERLRMYAEVIRAKGAPLQNCWGFVDWTACPICRPFVNQQNYFPGHKRQLCVKYQAVTCCDGIVTSLRGLVPGRRHDAGILRDFHLYE